MALDREMYSPPSVRGYLLQPDLQILSPADAASSITDFALHPSYAPPSTSQPYFFGQDMSHFLAAPTAQQLHQQTGVDFAATSAGLEPGMADGDNINLPTSQPEDTASDTGIYSCTYHGCTLRFDEHASLKNHRREAHMGRPMHGLSARNSQAGPHRCDRTNPSTGKPCGTVFSRPYDLTRHENTVHNPGKRKCRCHLCKGKKDFSRPDSLTRHMRTVHPNITWPGQKV
ncbi:hypothetical protein MaudCBS49596_001589 [Microsporum audouinii]